MATVITFTCPTCKGTDLTTEATVNWDQNKQRFTICGIFWPDKLYCQDCEEEFYCDQCEGTTDALG